jgi:uncharacterized protein (UPF0333 family)
MNFKGQGALEYLLMIGGGLAVAAIVLVFLFNGIINQTCQNAKRQVESLCNGIPDKTTCESNTGGDVSPNWAGGDCVWYIPALTSPDQTPKCTTKTTLSWVSISGCA